MNNQIKQADLDAGGMNIEEESHNSTACGLGRLSSVSGEQ